MKESTQIKNYNNIIDFLDNNSLNNKNLCLGYVYSCFKNKLIGESDFLYIITNYFISEDI